jgi:hypothetical protein
MQIGNQSLLPRQKLPSIRKRACPTFALPLARPLEYLTTSPSKLTNPDEKLSAFDPMMTTLPFTLAHPHP